MIKNNPILSKNTDAALAEVMTTIETLRAVYEEENNALINMDSNTFLALQDKKIDAARQYQIHMGQMIARKDEIARASQTTRDRLKDTHAQFQDISIKNMVAIDRMQRCTERLGNTIRNAAVRAAQDMRTYSYGENGAISNSARNKVVSSGLSETA